MIFQDIIHQIHHSHKVAILSHVMPDGDNIGASLALYHALCSMNKQVKYILDDDIPKLYRFLKGADQIGKPDTNDTYDLVIALDCGDEDRLGRSKKYMENAFVINIDHHISNKGFGNISLIEPDAAATGEIIYRLIKALGIVLDKDIAECLYTAIVTDTGRFQYSNTTAETHRIASELIGCGINISELSERIYQSESKEKILLIKKVLESIHFFSEDRISCIYLYKKDLEATGASDQECDGLIDYARDIDNVETAVFLREIGNDNIKVGLRSKKLIDVSKIAQKFGGGGHIRAAGVTIKGELLSVKDQIIEEIIKQFEAVSK